MKPLGTILVLFTTVVATQGQSTPESTTDHIVGDTLLITKSEKSSTNAQPIEKYAKRYIPRKAGLYSAVVPGLGQAYNKKYWKIPIFYAGVIGLGYGINFYQQQHKQFRTELFDILNSNTVTSVSGFSEKQLRKLVERTRRERDLFVILTVVLYLLGIAEAHIDAHLQEFELNEKLKLSLNPMIHRQSQLQTGLLLSFNF